MLPSVVPPPDAVKPEQEESKYPAQMEQPDAVKQYEEAQEEYRQTHQEIQPDEKADMGSLINDPFGDSKAEPDDKQDNQDSSPDINSLVTDPFGDAKDSDDAPPDITSLVTDPFGEAKDTSDYQREGRRESQEQDTRPDIDNLVTDPFGDMKGKDEMDDEVEPDRNKPEPMDDAPPEGGFADIVGYREPDDNALPQVTPNQKAMESNYINAVEIERKPSEGEEGVNPKEIEWFGRNKNMLDMETGIHRIEPMSEEGVDSLAITKRTDADTSGAISAGALNIEAKDGKVMANAEPQVRRTQRPTRQRDDVNNLLHGKKRGGRGGRRRKDEDDDEPQEINLVIEGLR